MMRVWPRLLEAIERQGRAAMVTVAAASGSVPRAPGARMIIGPDGSFTGTIGGGTLEWQALALAQGMLGRDDGPRAEIRRFALGPELGQCCGGRVDLLVERFGMGERPAIADLAARERAGPFATTGRVTSAGVERRVADAPIAAGTADFAEGIVREGFGDARRPLLLFGAGHVGRALVLALAPLPFAVTWIDPRAEAFPSHLPGNVTAEAVAEPATRLLAAPDGAFVLVMTHSHALDLDIAAAALKAGRFPYVGLIGSDTKRARFERRLAEMGIPADRIATLVCPIGIPGIDSKAPAMIAAATVAELLVRDEALRATGSPEIGLSRQRVAG
jgi:xanthine dehydrogenase accessory factor